MPFTILPLCVEHAHVPIGPEGLLSGADDDASLILWLRRRSVLETRRAACFRLFDMRPRPTPDRGPARMEVAARRLPQDSNIDDVPFV